MTPELREYVLRRDGGCVAGRVCTCLSSSPAVCGGTLTLDHVKDEPRLGVRAPSDARHLATVCSYHHLWSGWATSHRAALRTYLDRVEPAA